LEASLLREQEFNAANHRINADYLMNVIKRFLNSTDTSERERLIPVLCQMLHISADETRQIMEKWAPRSTGLVGWFMPPRTVATNIDKKPGDVTYDATTGAGVHMY
jgi:hypothetical protein